MYKTDTYQASQTITLNHYINNTFKWMMLGIVITFVTAFTLEKTNLAITLLMDMPMFSIVVIIIQFGIAIYFGARLFKLNHLVAKALFILYAFITGVTFSMVFMTYTSLSVSLAFLIAALYFGVLVFIGAFIKMDLTKIGTLCFAGLFVYLIYASLATIFGWGQYLLPFISIILFAGITAYDMQKTINLYNQYSCDLEMVKRLSIFVAFELYLDFINIFLDLLQILGDND